MTEHKKRKVKSKLPCHWVEDDKFHVIPIQRPGEETDLLPDAALVLKPKNPLPARAAGS